MSNITKWNDKAEGREKVGIELVKVGAGGGLAMLAAGLLPFVTLPMVFIAMVVFGLFVAL